MASRNVFLDRTPRIQGMARFHEIYHQLVNIVTDSSSTGHVMAISNLDVLWVYQFLLSDENIKKICNRVVDYCQNNLWHIYSQKSSYLPFVDFKLLFSKLDINMINNRNIFGETPLHLAEKGY